MPIIVLSPFNVVNFPQGGGHFWVYMQYVQGLLRLGCEVYWLEQFRPGEPPDRDSRAMATFFERMARVGLAGGGPLFTGGGRGGGGGQDGGAARREGPAVRRRAG